MLTFLCLAFLQLLSILLPVYLVTTSWRSVTISRGIAPRIHQPVFRAIQCRDILLAVLLLEVFLLPCVILIGQLLFAALVWGDICRMLISRFCGEKKSGLDDHHQEEEVDRLRKIRKKPRRQKCGKCFHCILLADLALNEII